jgi:hypothetical protein
MKMPKLKVAFLLAGVLLVVIFSLGRFLVIGIAQVKKMKTGDTLGVVWITLDRTLPDRGPLSGYDVAAHARLLFPELKIVNGEIVDAWGKPLRVSIESASDGFHVRIISAGRDGKFNTADDIDLHPLAGQNCG